jgi:hypothetical protein
LSSNKKTIEHDDEVNVRDSSQSIGKPLKLSKLSVNLNEKPSLKVRSSSRAALEETQGQEWKKEKKFLVGHISSL